MSIRIENIHKSFGAKHVLTGIDFEFETGKVNMIIGASGSGKTVLMKCMVGLLKPEIGRVYYGGQDLLSLNHKKTRDLRKNIGMLFQSAALFDSLTVAENVAFPLRMFTNEPARKITERVKYCLNRVDLYNVEELYPSSLSGGMKKRVGLARAIALNPKYLFCDEPNSGLDPETAAIIDQLILDITQDFHTTTIVITHDMKSMLEIGDKVLFIYKGGKEWEGRRDMIKDATNPQLVSFMKTSGLAKHLSEKL